MQRVNQRFLCVVFAGGGTGGHLYPAIAIADALRDRKNVRATFIGTADRLEATIVPKAGYPLRTVASRPRSRGLTLEIVRTLVANTVGVAQSIALLARLRPDLIVASGGYVCFPVVLAARMLRALHVVRAPIVLLEPNALPGLTNRTVAPLVDEVWGALPSGNVRFAGKYVHTGIPVRAALRELPSREAAVARLGLDRQRKTLFAMGGSQGARTINEAVRAMLERDGVPTGWQVLLVTGEADRQTVVAPRGVDAVILPYLEEIAYGYAAADLVLARAGASTLAELAAAGKPAILVPYPFAADDHQTANARTFASTGAAVVVADDEVAAGSLPAAVGAATAPVKLEELQRCAQRLRGEDPLATILARVDRLVERTTVRELQ